VLGLLFGQPSRSFFASELIELTGSGSGAVQRELKRLSSSGLVTVKRIGKQKHYQANPDCPVFEELSRAGAQDRCHGRPHPAGARTARRPDGTGADLRLGGEGHGHARTATSTCSSSPMT
jgi:hypothetical protein